MKSPSYAKRPLRIPFVILALGAVIGVGVLALRAEDAKQPAPDPQKVRLNRQAIQQEILAQPEGIHKISDGSIVIKSGPGMAHVHADLHGCGTGCNGNAAPANDADNELMAGIFFGLFMNPQEGAKIGIGADQAAKIKDAYNYMDHAGTHPSPVLKLYEQYVKLPEGKARVDAEKALMDKVRAVGQAYVDVEIKKRKDVKALLTPNQATSLRAMGAKMIHPFDKPVA